MSPFRCLIRIVCLAVVALGATEAVHAQSYMPTKSSPQAVYPAAQSPAVPYCQPTLITPQPIATTPVPPPTPVVQPTYGSAQASPQASAQGPAPCACYYPQGFCPMPQGNCSMPQGNCVAPVQPCGPAPSGQYAPAPVYAQPQTASAY